MQLFESPRSSLSSCTSCGRKKTSCRTPKHDTAPTSQLADICGASHRKHEVSNKQLLLHCTFDPGMSHNMKKARSISANHTFSGCVLKRHLMA